MILASTNADAKVRAIAVKDLLDSISKELMDPAELVFTSEHSSCIKSDLKIGIGIYSLYAASSRPRH
jgi:hypothetical protein